MSDTVSNAPGQAAGSLHDTAGKSFGTFGYRSFVLMSLTVVYTFNFIDRILISVVSVPIINEFQLSQFQFGLLSGIGFALFYTLLGIPIANLSERVSRKLIIGVCVILWSLATVLCGFTTGFVTLLLARMLVGVGEAGCTPPANSMISDYYAPSARPTALGIYAMGVTAGGVLAQVFGGFILDYFTWREAFIFVGAPGILLGIVFLLTVKEPPRGHSDPAGTVKVERASFRDAMREIVSKRTFWIMTAGATIAAFAGYALVGLQPQHVVFTHGYTPAQTALMFMAPVGLAGTLGAFLGGYLTERASRSSATAATWVPGIAFLICAPIYASAFLVGNSTLMLILLMSASTLQYFYLGAQYNIAQAVVSLRVRATSVAILLFVVNLIGYGAGPPALGIVADIMSSNWIGAAGLTGQITASCSLTDPGLTEELIASCREARAHGVKWACVVATGLFVLAGLFFLASGRTFIRDLYSQRDMGKSAPA
ncbi:MAG: MFS transporter [Henriciella sp.]|uniref:spinster family MFS transporter n=1 Tax=Henriciella sp. TaxID=1968823 RepID=UPI003C73295D